MTALAVASTMYQQHGGLGNVKMSVDRLMDDCESEVYTSYLKRKHPMVKLIINKFDTADLFCFVRLLRSDRGPTCMNFIEYHAIISIGYRKNRIESGSF